MSKRKGRSDHVTRVNETGRKPGKRGLESGWCTRVHADLCRINYNGGRAGFLPRHMFCLFFFFFFFPPGFPSFLHKLNAEKRFLLATEEGFKSLSSRS